MNQNGEILTSGEDINKEAERLFKSFLTNKPSNYKGMSIEELQEVLDFLCMVEDKDQLIKEVFVEEIKNILFSMPNNKPQDRIGSCLSFSKLRGQLL